MDGYVFMLMGWLMLIASELHWQAIDWRLWLAFWSTIGNGYLLFGLARKYRIGSRKASRIFATILLITLWISGSLAWDKRGNAIYLLIKPVPQIVLIRGYVGPIPSLSSPAGTLLSIRMRHWYKPEDFGVRIG